MIHHFDTDIACKVGTNKAVILQNIHFWIQKNKANNKNFYDGKYWTYNSGRAFVLLFPYIKKRTLENYLKELEDDGYLFVGNYNKTSYDQTKWFSINYQKMGNAFTENCEWQEEANNSTSMSEDEKENNLKSSSSVEHIQKSANGFTENCGTIPYINTDSKPNKNKSSCAKSNFARSSSSSSKSQSINTLTDCSDTLSDEVVRAKEIPAIKLSRYMLECIRVNTPNYKLNKDKALIKLWAKDIDKIIRIDKRTPQEIEDMIYWIQNDDFWYKNVLSGSKLRKQFDDLLVKRNIVNKNTEPPVFKGRMTSEIIKQSKNDPVFKERFIKYLNGEPYRVIKQAIQSEENITHQSIMDYLIKYMLNNLSFYKLCKDNKILTEILIQVEMRSYTL